MESTIPFYIFGSIGKKVSFPIRLESGTKMLEYKYVCELPDGRLTFFRLGRDARLAAKGNGWKCLGEF